jgi:hypothetical protein
MVSSEIDCVKKAFAFLGLLEKESFVQKCKVVCAKVFEKMLKWFFKSQYTHDNHDYPPRTSSGKEVCLLDLYLCLRSHGGYEKVCKSQQVQRMIGEALGIPKEEDVYIHIIYNSYLSFLLHFYENRKQEEKENSQEAKWKPRQVCARRDFPKGCGPVKIKESKGSKNQVNEKDDPNEQDAPEELSCENDQHERFKAEIVDDKSFGSSRFYHLL